MKDTPKGISDRQRELIHSKTEEERSQLGAEMIDSIYGMVKNQIIEQSPGANEVEIKEKLFLRLYKNDFSEQQKKRIIASFKNAE